MKVCRTSQQAVSQAISGRKKVAWSASEESMLRQRAKAQNRINELTRRAAKDDIEAEQLLKLQQVEEAQRIHESVSAELHALLPNEHHRIDDMMARTFGIHRKMFGLSDDFTTAGSIKMSLVNAKRNAQALVDNAGLWVSKKTRREAMDAAYDIMKSKGVKRADADDFIHNMLEVATHPRQKAAYGNTKGQNAVLTKRYNAMLKEAEGLGISTDELNQMVHAANKAASAQDAVRIAAQVEGVSVDELENIGYVARQFTDKAERFFKLKGIPTDVVGKRAVGTSTVQQTRSTWQLIPKDYQALSEVLMPGAYADWNTTVKNMVALNRDTSVDVANKTLNSLKAQAKKAREAVGDALPGEVKRLRGIADDLDKQVLDATKNVDNIKAAGTKDYNALLEINGGDDTRTMNDLAILLGKPVDDLMDLRATHTAGQEQMILDLHNMFEDGVGFTKYMHDNLSAEQLDELVDSGILSKVPMTAREVFDYMGRQYKLPWTKPSDMFVMSLEDNIQAYTSKMRKAAGEAALIKTLTDEGLHKGWVVPTVELNDTHKGFVELSGIDVKRFGIDPDVAENWKGLHVHPSVYYQLEAQLDLATNPGNLAALANFVSYVNRNFNVLTLAGQGIAFLSRNVIGGGINYGAAGGNYMRLIPAAHEYASVLKNGLEVLDDTKPFLNDAGTWITKREAFQRFFVQRGTDYVSNEAGIKLGSQAGRGNPILNYGQKVLAGLPGALAEQYQFYKMHDSKLGGTLGALKLGTQQFDDYVRTVFAPIAYGNALTDGTYKWAALCSLMEVHGVSGNVQKGLSSISGFKSFTNMQDALNHIDQYFIDGQSAGTAQKFISKYIKPFGMFAMSSPPMALRHMLRNPAQFMAYSRLIRMQHRSNMADPDQREAGFSPFELQSIPLTFFKSPDGKQVLSLSPVNVDMFQGSLAYAAVQAQRVQRLMGQKTGVGPVDRGDLIDPYGINDFIKDNLKENNNPMFAALSELMTGKDARGKDIEDNKRTEIGGATVDPFVYWMASKLPAFSSVNAMLGGRGAITDDQGRVLKPAEAGMFGTPNREATRSEESAFYAERTLGTEQYKLLKNFLGLNVKTIDLAEGRQYTLKDIRYTGRELEKKAKQLYDTEQPSPERTKKIQLLQNQWLQLSVDAHRVKKWMDAHGVPEREALDKLKQLDIRVRSLPISTPEINNYMGQSLRLGQPSDAR